jgi:hypothetical protein
MMATPSAWPIEYLVQCPAKLRAFTPRFEDVPFEEYIAALPHLPACMALWVEGVRQPWTSASSFRSLLPPDPTTLLRLRELGLTESMYPTPDPQLDTAVSFWNTLPHVWYQHEEFVTYLKDTYTLDWPLLARMTRISPGCCRPFGTRVPTARYSAQTMLRQLRSISEALGVVPPDVDLARYITAALWAAAVHLRQNQSHVLLDASNIPLQSVEALTIGTPWVLLAEQVQSRVLDLIAGWQLAFQPPSEPGRLWSFIENLLDPAQEDEDVADIFTGPLRGQRRDDDAEDAFANVMELRRLCMNLRAAAEAQPEPSDTSVTLTTWISGYSI